MIFWIIVALLTFIASVAVMYPFLRPQSAISEVDHDLAVYRDQLSELEKEVKRGLISKEDAAEARAEIGRRILKLSEDGEAGRTSSASQKMSRFIAAAGILAIPVVSWGLYGFLGSPGLPAMPLEARLQTDPTQASVGDLIGRAERHLAANPQDIRGWEALAPIYMRLGRYQDAVEAYRQMISLGGSKADIEALLGEALVGVAGGVVSSDADAAFNRALALDSKEPRARFFSALGNAQEGRFDDARGVWTEMVDELPQDSPWRAVAQEALAANPGAATSDILAQPDADQRDMIEGMVASLDARLRDNPDDPEGWQRLVRSYIVLERPQDAQNALERGVEALGANSPAATKLDEFAKDLGISRSEGGS